MLAGLALLGSDVLAGCNKMLERLAFRAEALWELPEFDVWGGEIELVLESVLEGEGARVDAVMAGKGP